MTTAVATPMPYAAVLDDVVHALDRAAAFDPAADISFDMKRVLVREALDVVYADGIDADTAVALVLASL